MRSDEQVLHKQVCTDTNKKLFDVYIILGDIVTKLIKVKLNNQKKSLVKNDYESQKLTMVDTWLCNVGTRRY